MIYNFNRYRARYWRQSVFKGLDLIKESVINTNGSANVSQMIETAFRWLCHHSDMKPECGGILIMCIIIYYY